MKAEIVILSCAGTLMVIFNKPLGRALLWLNAELYVADKADYNLWSFRAPLIIIGVLLTCLSFTVYD